LLYWIDAVLASQNGAIVANPVQLVARERPLFRFRLLICRLAAERTMDRIDATRLSSTALPAEALDARSPSDRQPAQALDIVFIEDFLGETVIGIDTSELHVPQAVRMNLTIGVPSLKACVTDRIEDTINYAAVRAALHELLATHGVKLLEALAEKVAQCLIRDFGAHWVRVAIAKPAKFDDVKAVGVIIERRRPVAGNAAYTWASLGAGLIPSQPN
jgi:dihydroneopterin aldolase